MSKGPVISIVEDDAAVRAATENLVKSLGFDVYTFASAQEFLQSHREAETACLISILTIFMTAFPDESVRRRAMAAGAVGFLHKPFNGKALIQFIQDAISQGGGKA